MADVGAPSASGTVSYGGGAVAVGSAGGDVAGASDQFTFLYRPISGDATVIARVAALQALDGSTVAGLMIRESLAAGARHAFIGITSTTVAMRSRSAAGGTTTQAGASAGSAPAWLKIERRGGALIASRSADGINWLLVGSAVVPMASDIAVGLAVASHVPGSRATASFTDIEVVGSGALPAGWTGADVGAPAVPGGSTTDGVSVILDAAGTGISGGGDQMRFVHQAISGDADIVARVAFAGAAPTALAGVMVRQALTGPSAHAAMLVSAAGGTVMRARSTYGALTTSTSASGAAPLWVRVSRRGNVLVTARSADGVTWTTVNQQTVPLTEPYYVGLVVTGGDGVQRARAYFDGVQITRQNAAPAVTLTSPASAMTIPTPVSLTLAATASDADGTVAQVDFFAGPTLVGSDTTSPYTFLWTNVKPGSYVIKAVARDDKGASTTSVERAVTVTGNVPPTVSLTAPTGTTAPARTAMVLAASASDTDGTIARVEFFAGSALVGSDATAPYSVTWPDVPAGTYGLRAVAIDNTGASTATAVRTVTVVGNAAPTVTLSQPSAPATVAAGTTVVLAATAADSDGTVARVEFYANATLVATDQTSPYAFSWTATSGVYAIKAVAYDNAGASTASAQQTVTVASNAAPSVRLTQPAAGGRAAPGTAVVVVATASDSDGQVARVEFYANGTLLGVQKSSPYAVTWNTSTAGTYTLRAVAFDDDGASTAASASFTVGQNQLPSVSLTAPAAAATAPALSTVTITAAAADTDGTVARVEFFAGGTLLGADTSSPYSYAWVTVPAGAHVLTAVAVDDAGGRATSSARTLTVSATDAAPVVTLTSPSNDAVFTAGAGVTLAAAVTGGGPIESVEFYVGTTRVARDTASPYAFTWSSVPVGTYGITAVARDAAGNMTVSSARDISVVAAGIPDTVAFAPSVDHETVDRYVLEIYGVGDTPGADAPVVTRNLGRPAIVDGECLADVSTLISGLPAGTYVASVVAQDSQGEGRSRSVMFTR